jgi:hypothetical protein
MIQKSMTKGAWVLEALNVSNKIYTTNKQTRGVSHCGLAIFEKNPLKETKILSDFITL